jgi:hypothetical protein
MKYGKVLNKLFLNIVSIVFIILALIIVTFFFGSIFGRGSYKLQINANKINGRGGRK